MRPLPPVTVIVPTRNRADTLPYALRTCLTQDYDRLTILVSDNFSEDETADVISQFSDKRIRRLRTDRRLGMSQHWEFALAHVDDGYVLYLGDDDALLPNAIQDVVRLLAETDCEAIAWREAKYNWPNTGGPRENQLRIPLRTRQVIRDARQALQQVLAFKEPYEILPSPYWGVLHRNVFRRATGPSGRFFASRIPDVYSAVASAMVLERYVLSDRPYRIGGISRHSTGTSFMSGGASSKDSPSAVFLGESNLEFHRSYVLVPSPPVWVAEAYQQAREHVPRAAAFADLPLERTMDAMLMVAARDVEGVYTVVAEAVREMGRRASNPDLADRLIARNSYLRPDRIGARIPDARFGRLRQPKLVLDGDDFAVRDVQGAAILCHTVLQLIEAGARSPAGFSRRVAAAVKERVRRLYNSRGRGARAGHQETSR